MDDGSANGYNSSPSKPSNTGIELEPKLIFGTTRHWGVATRG